jgi:drug/metabolite transporter (DMT)-like permease
MILWLMLGILSYLFYAISTSIDKFMMNQKYDVFRTNTIKMLLDGLILLVIGFLFFKLSISWALVLWSAVLGLLNSASGILYFNSLKLKDVGQVIPYIQSGGILLIFIASVIVFNEIVTPLNYLGVFLILVGVYAVLSENGFKAPKLDKAFFIILIITVLHLFYYLLAKKVLFSIKAIDLSIAIYFSSTIILVLYQLLFRRKSSGITRAGTLLPKIIPAAFFGALGTFLLFSAASLGNASKVYPLAGLQSAFIFIIALLFLKEKFYWHRLAGTMLVFLGIFFVSL